MCAIAAMLHATIISTEATPVWLPLPNTMHHAPCTMQQRLRAFEAAARARLKDDIYTYSTVTVKVGMGIGIGVEVGDSSYCCRLTSSHFHCRLCRSLADRFSIDRQHHATAHSPNLSHRSVQHRQRQQRQQRRRRRRRRFSVSSLVQQIVPNNTT